MIHDDKRNTVNWERGKYEQPTIEPAGGTYLKTYADGQLRQAQPGKLDCADFDLYKDAVAGS